MAVGRCPCPIFPLIPSSLALSWMLPFCPYLSLHSQTYKHLSRFLSKTK